MKKIVTVLFLVAAAALVFGLILSGCVSYRGQYDTSVPLSEQATLKIPGNLRATDFDDNSLGLWGYGRVTGERLGGTLLVNFPVGEHTFTFDYLNVSTSTSGNYQTTTTSSASGMTATVDMKPGHTYKAVVSRYSGNKIGVNIVEEKAGEPKDTFSALEIQTMYKLGYKFSLNPEYYSIPFDFGAALQIGQVFDGKTIQGWHIDLGVDFVSFFALQASVSTGVTYEYYFPKTKTNMGLSIGGAMNYVTDFEKFVFYPTARLAFMPWRRSAKFGLYGEYNFSNSIKIFPDGEEGNDYLQTDSIGLGIIYSF